MSIKTIKNILPIFFILFLAACSGFFEKDNTPTPTPLAPITPEIRPKLLWSTNTGTGSGKEYLRMGPTLSGDVLFTVGSVGNVTAIDKFTGNILWQSNTHTPLTTPAAVGDGLVVVGSSQGIVVALQASCGRPIWRRNVPGAILAKPAISHGIIVIKTQDGTLRGLAVEDGRELWSSRQAEPTLILRGASAPVIRDRSIIAGFANGTLGKFTLAHGRPIWTEQIAVPEGAFDIQRMIDIDADPVLYGYHVYAATYQGKIVSLNWISGRVNWSHEISSYTGMVPDDHNIYVSDAKSHVWAFNSQNGFVNWRQIQLEFRGVSAPTMIDNYVVVGDAEGFVHWISKQDGHIAARVAIGSSIYGTPVAEQNIVYALNNYGYLAAYSL